VTPRRLLIVTAVEAEAAAVRAGLPQGPPDVASRGAFFGDFASVRVAPVGVGPAAAAAGTARLLALAEARGEACTAVISAGIAGGFTGRAEVGATVLGIRTIAADLGAEAPTADLGFIPIEDLGFGTSVVAADSVLLTFLTSALPHAVPGDILTLATVTGTATTADRLRARFPAAVAEAMEGYGVACAAQAAGLPFVELRAISNPVGPRDRAAWRLREAFSALTDAVQKACG
jgi:futalosine hydrolase